MFLFRPDSSKYAFRDVFKAYDMIALPEVYVSGFGGHLTQDLKLEILYIETL